MTRPLLDQARIHPAALAQISTYHTHLIAEVEAAVAANKVVVVGMGLNPFPAKARKILERNGTPYTYLSYGNYFSSWRPRLALKLWSGWSTFPMIFVNGTLIGGATDLQKLIDSGEFARLLG
ncbi:glutaredoxin-related protein [Duganella sp. 1224]|uniref:glutaredoxin n=1 Tax=Duganella sp. 1224 TaxID=2587052 RepID=UPI0015C989C7|nr:glutaredoxin [Duganella sp. 1224]NYE59218.1 glutaredoxin-related protein [Duganella sp. 1224]